MDSIVKLGIARSFRPFQRRDALVASKYANYGDCSWENG